MQNTSLPQRRKGYFDFKKLINELPIKRQLRVILKALAILCPAGSLTTHDFPVTYERLQAETGYSRSHTMALIKEASQTPYLRVHKQPYIREDGTKWNRANVYELVLPDVECSTVAQKRPKKAPAPPPESEFASPASELVQPPAPEPEPTISYATDYAERTADQSTITTVDESQNVSGSDLSGLDADGWAEWHAQTEALEPCEEPEPAPESIQAPTKPLPATERPMVSQVVVPQSPEGFTDDEQDTAELVEQHARKTLDVLAKRDATRFRATMAILALIECKYAIGRSARHVADHYGYGDKEITDCVDEWIRKCVIGREAYTPKQLAIRLQIFFRKKGEKVDESRMNTLNRTI